MVVLHRQISNIVTVEGGPFEKSLPQIFLIYHIMFFHVTELNATVLFYNIKGLAQ